MINEKVFIGEPLKFEKEIKIYIPTVKDIITCEYFPMYRKLLLSSQEDIEDDIEEQKKKGKQAPPKIPTPFEFMLGGAIQDKNIQFLVREAFRFFIHEEIYFLPEQKMIILGDVKERIKQIKSIDELCILKEENYLKFQNLLRQSIGEKSVEPPDPNLHPKIKAMKAKARYRDKIKAKQQGLPFSVSLGALCCMGIGINPLNIREIPYASVSAIISTYQEKEKYETDLKSMLAGAKGIKLKYWIRNYDKD